MKFLKKAFSVLFTLAFLLSIFAFDSKVVNASYTYRIKISLGNNANAYFDETGVNNLGASYEVSQSGRNLVISNLAYDSTVTFNYSDIIKIKADNTETQTSKYYVKGLRVSGSDDLVDATNKVVNLTVLGDESYVVAYGVGTIIPYTVRYVDEEGNQLLDDETLYAAKGEVVFVPSRHIKGYVPDAYYKTASKGLREDMVFEFVYSKRVIGEEVEVTETTETSSVTVEGDPTYEYEYEYVDGGANTIFTHGGSSTSVSHQSNSSTNSGTVNNRGDGDNGDANAGANAGGDTSISEGDTPTNIVDIDENDPPKAGGTRDDLIRNMIIGIAIAIIAVVSIIVTLYIANRKRNQELAKVETSKE